MKRQQVWPIKAFTCSTASGPSRFKMRSQIHLWLLHHTSAISQSAVYQSQWSYLQLPLLFTVWPWWHFHLSGWTVGGELGGWPLVSLSAPPLPHLIQVPLRRKLMCQKESRVHYKSPVRKTAKEVARKTHALYCVLVGVSRLDKQLSVR